MVKIDSYNTVTLNWLDNSNDEDGFIIYRDKTEISRIGPNATAYQDKNLTPATTYYYSVQAYNQYGKSGTSSYTVTTPNPPITIKLNKIGVFDNREDITRGKDGEIYIYVVISDGKNPIQKIRFPKEEDLEYKLAKNETADINSQIFNASEVGDKLTLMVIGYESDGEGFEPYVYSALGLAAGELVWGIPGALLELFNYDLANIIGDFLGKEDDFLGSYERTWDKNSNWGTGEYTDIVCKDERGVDCLRLWFSINSQ